MSGKNDSVHSNMNFCQATATFSEFDRLLLDEESLRCDELQVYFDCDRGERRDPHSAASDKPSKLDPVAKSLVGRANISRLCSVAPKFAGDILAFLRADGPPNRVGLLLRDQSEFIAVVNQKRLPNHDVKKTMVAHLEALSCPVKCGLLVRRPTGYKREPVALASYPQPPARSTAQSNASADRAQGNAAAHASAPSLLVRANALYAGAFTVPKSGVDPVDGRPLLRFIIDARLANAVFKTCGLMLVFQVEALLAATARLSSTHETWYAISADLRHWFHQIPIPKHWQDYFLMWHGKRAWAPVTLPMGFNSAPAIAQAALWAIILRGLHCNDTSNTYVQVLRNKLGVAQFDDSIYPHWVPLDCGGGIFVLIGNVLICTHRQDRIEAWAKRLRAASKQRSAGGFNVEFKCEHGKDPIIISTLARSPSESVKFCGIEFKHSHCRPINRPEVPRLLNQDCWTGTYRELASLIGKTIWCHRVTGEPLLNHEGLMMIHATTRPNFKGSTAAAQSRTSRGVMWEEQDDEEETGQTLAAATASRSEETWASFVTLQSEQTRVLMMELQAAANDQFHRQPNVPTGYSFITFGATDASLEESKGRLGWAGFVAEPPQIPWQALPDPTIVGHKSHSDPHIALAELRAIMVLIQRAQIEDRVLIRGTTAAAAIGQRRGLHIIATDSMAAKACWNVATHHRRQRGVCCASFRQCSAAITSICSGFHLPPIRRMASHASLFHVVELLFHIVCSCELSVTS